MSDYFPPELIEKIFLKLPAKSLIRFTTVCKSWRSIITSPSFVSSYLYKPTNQTLLLRRYGKHDEQERYSLLDVKSFSIIDSSSEFEFPLKSRNGGYFRIVGSCRGIVCLSDDYFPNRKQRVFLWNPCCVNKHFLLPKPTINPEKLHFVLGFGCDDANHDFKVVRFDPLGISAEAEVFSLRTGKWRRLLETNARLHVVEFTCSHIFVKEALHWLGFPYNDDTTGSILVFRVDPEVFAEIQLPDELSRVSVTRLSLTSIGGSLAVACYKKDLRNAAYWEVWLMKEYGVESSWARWYCIPELQGMEDIVALLKGGEALVASEGIGLVAFDLKNLETRNLGIQGVTHGFHVEDYVECLELLRGAGDIGEELSEAEEEA